MTPDVGTVRAEKRRNRSLEGGFLQREPFGKDISTGSPETNKVVLVLRSSKVVHKRTPPMPRRFGGTPPNPRTGFAVQLPGCDPRRLVDLVAVREALPGEGLSPEYTPPALDEVEPGRSLRDESVFHPWVPFEPPPYQDAVVDLQIVGDQVDKTPWDGPLYLLQ